MEERQRGYKRTPRFTKRLEARFSSGGLSFRGILSNVSVNGIFIRTNRGFAPGTTVDIELVMPDNKIARVKGIVRRTLKTPVTLTKNGMGIELTHKDEVYKSFLASFLGERSQEEEESSPEPSYQIISCPGCGVKNKVSVEKFSLIPRCGKCGEPLPVRMP